MTIELQVDMSSLKKIVYAIAAEEGSGQLKRDLARNLRSAVSPAVAESKQSILAMRSATPHTGESLRSSIAQKVRTTVRYSGSGAGVKVSAAWGGPRGFQTSARRTNREAGWRHPVFEGGRDRDIRRFGARSDVTDKTFRKSLSDAYGGRWVHQVGKPEWFETPLREHRDQYRDAVLQAMQDMATRIARRV